ncbi:MAG TPA: carboxypeptidase-like regulatory domain-containing protein [Terriglobia bacterium]|nr:carboxypeptidase-like regulatory domain-containing protein [Terriglobia bacterium]
MHRFALLIRKVRRGPILAGLFIFPILPAYGQASHPAPQPLTLEISVNTQAVTAPLPIRVTLHVHNSGAQAIWLYRPVRDAAEAGADMDRPRGGSTLVTRISPLNLPAGAVVNLAAIGKVMKPAKLPHPKLVQLDPGGDFEETLAIRILPALLRGPSGSSGNLPFWGSYRFSVIYGAGYPNGDDLRRDVGVVPWEGGVTSNALEITLAAPPASDRGSVSGSIVNQQSGFVGDAVVSLSAQDGHLLNQMVTNSSGRFSFSSLPPGTYWVTVREEGSTQAGGMYEHATLTADQPETSLKLLLAREDISDAKKLLHKPVLFRVTDSANQPVDGALLDDTWSDGPVMEDLKGRTGAAGVVVMDVLPGSNYVSVKKKGCRSKDERSQVSSDIGVDGFNLIFDCERK